MVRAERSSYLKLVVGGGREDDGGTPRLGELHRKERHPTGPLGHDDVARADTRKRRPGGGSRAREGARLRQAEVIRDADEAVGRKGPVLLQPAIFGVTRCNRQLRPGQPPVDPGRMKRAEHPVTHRKVGDAIADGYHLTRAVRHRNPRPGPVDEAEQIDQIVIVQTGAPHPDQCFEMTGLRHVSLAWGDVGAGRQHHHCGLLHVACSHRMSLAGQPNYAVIQRIQPDRGGLSCELSSARA